MKNKRKAMALIMVLFTVILVASLGAIFLKVVFTNRYQSKISGESLKALTLSQSGIELAMQYMAQPNNWTDSNDLDTANLPPAINCTASNTPDGFSTGTITFQADGSDVVITHDNIQLSGTYTGRFTTRISRVANSYIRFKVKSTGELLSNGVVIARKNIEYTLMADDPRNYGQFISIPQDGDLFGLNANRVTGRTSDTTLENQVGIAQGWATNTNAIRADSSNGQFLFSNNVLNQNPPPIAIKGILAATSRNSFQGWNVSANTTFNINDSQLNNVTNAGKGYTTSPSIGLPEGDNYRYFNRILQGLQNSGITPGNGSTTQILSTAKNAPGVKGVFIDVGKDAFMTRPISKAEVKNSLFYAASLDKEVQGQINIEHNGSTENIYITDEEGGANKYLYNDGDKVVVVPPTIHISSSSDGKTLYVKVVKADGSVVSNKTINLGSKLANNDGDFDGNNFVIYSRGGNIVIDGDSNGVFTENANLTIIADTNPHRITNDGKLNTSDANSVFSTQKAFNYYKVCKSTDGTKLAMDAAIASNPDSAITKMYAASEGNVIIKARVVKRGGLSLQNQTVDAGNQTYNANVLANDASSTVNSDFANNNLTIVSKNFVFLGGGDNSSDNYAKDEVHIGASVYSYNHSMQLIDYDFFGRFLLKLNNDGSLQPGQIDADGEVATYTIPNTQDNPNNTAFFDFMGSYVAHYADSEGFTDNGNTLYGYTRFQRLTYDYQVKNIYNPYAPYFMINKYNGIVRFSVINVKSY